MLYKQPTSKYWYVKLKHRGGIVRRSTGETNRRAAERIEREWRAELKKNRKQSAHTFSEAVLRWLKEKEHKKSIEGDKTILKWFGYHLEGLYLSDITRDKIEEVRTEKLKEAGRQTVNNYMRCLRAVLRIARDDWEWVDKIPKVPMYEVTEREPRFLSLDEFLLIASELPAHLQGPAWFSIATGLRTAPIQKLQWNWIQRDGLRIPSKIMKAGNSLAIPLSQTAWHVLAEQWGKHEDTVFVNHVGMPFAEKFTKGAWKKAVKRAGLDGVTFHDMRHTFASWMLQKGIPEHVIMELGGWKTRKAFKIYAHHSSESIERLSGYV